VSGELRLVSDRLIVKWTGYSDAVEVNLSVVVVLRRVIGVLSTFS
jgi:hypothetical protein